MTILKAQITKAFWNGQVPAKKVKLKGGEEAWVASVFDLFVANYGLDRGLGDDNSQPSPMMTNLPYTPAWAEQVTGVPSVTRSSQLPVNLPSNAEKTRGRSMVILGCWSEPLVPHGHELPRHHQHAGDVRVRRPVRRRLERTMSGRRNCARRPAGCHLAFALDWAARRGR